MQTFVNAVQNGTITFDMIKSVTPSIPYTREQFTSAFQTWVWQNRGLTVDDWTTSDVWNKVHPTFHNYWYNSNFATIYETGQPAIITFADNVGYAVYVWHTTVHADVVNAGAEFIEWFKQQPDLMGGVYYTQEWAQAVATDPELAQFAAEMYVQLSAEIAGHLEDINASIEDLWAHIAYEMSFVPWMSLDMESLSQVDWQHDINWAAIWSASQDANMEVSESLAEICEDLAPVIQSPEFAEVWQSLLLAPEIQTALTTSGQIWHDFEESGGEEWLALGLYYSAMNVPEVAQVV